MSSPPLDDATYSAMWSLEALEATLASRTENSTTFIGGGRGVGDIVGQPSPRRVTKALSVATSLGKANSANTHKLDGWHSLTQRSNPALTPTSSTLQDVKLSSTARPQSLNFEEAEFPVLHSPQKMPDKRGEVVDRKSKSQCMSTRENNNVHLGWTTNASSGYSAWQKPETSAFNHENLLMRDSREKGATPPPRHFSQAKTSAQALSKSTQQQVSHFQLRPVVETGSEIDAEESSCMQKLAKKFPHVDSEFLCEVINGVGGREIEAEICLNEMGLLAESVTVEDHYGLDAGKTMQRRLELVTDPATASAVDNLGSLSNAEQKLSVKKLHFPTEGNVESRVSDATDVGIDGEMDVYYKYRGDALRLSRARGRHFRSAMNAYNTGDHSRAQELSKMARKEGQLAGVLHMEAAKQILQARNADRPGGINEIDLHALHGPEAVAALQHRLAELEQGPLPFSNAGVMVQSAAKDADFSKQRATVSASKVFLHRPELMVITGQGNHSKGDGKATLPSFVKSFLVENEYVFRQAKAGVIAVRPKIRLLNGSMQ